MSRERALDVARRRGFAVVSWIANAGFGALATTSTTMAEMDPGLSLVLLLLVAGFVVVTTARLAKAVHGTAIAVLCGIGVVIPFVWIAVAITLLVTSSRLIKASGARVSFFGRDLLS
jgi:hypothetical protein